MNYFEMLFSLVNFMTYYLQSRLVKIYQHTRTRTLPELESRDTSLQSLRSFSILGNTMRKPHSSFTPSLYSSLSLEKLKRRSITHQKKLGNITENNFFIDRSIIQRDQNSNKFHNNQSGSAERWRHNSTCQCNRLDLKDGEEIKCIKCGEKVRGVNAER